MAERRWEQLELLYEALVATEASQRLDLLRALDPVLREELRSLLAFHDPSSLERTGPGMEPVTEVQVGITPPPRAADPGTDTPDRIGPYRILRLVGEGGMGVVYEADQEKPVRRKVALKLIKKGMDTRAVIGRFESERQALALMSHPNIAGVYDAGATARGRPYFAMEFVPGIPITEYCDDHRLPIRKRLELFIQVCEGVQHAHQKGIIHRDIKPSNVLVAVPSDKPVPKIIDFGVAKATLQRLTEHSVHTELGQIIGTPEYMSPEQADMTNVDIDTRTDVYSLGVLLFELLVGTQPFDATSPGAGGLLEIQRRLREEDPPRPSVKAAALGENAAATASNRRVDVGGLQRQLRGDLDWIALKALERDRARRYGSAFELGADIQRHLRNEPVLARPPSKWYRLAKLIQRHRPAVVAAVAVAASLVIGTAVAIVQANRAVRAEEVATRRRQQADALISFMVGDLREQLTAMGRLDVLDAAADQSLKYFAAMDLSDLDSVSLGTYVQALRFIGLVRIDQGRPREALVALERAGSLAEQLTEIDPEVAAFWRQRSDAVSDLGEAYWELKQDDRTLASMSDAVEHLKRAIALEPDNEEDRLALAVHYNNLGAVNTRGRRLEAALNWFDEAAETTDRLLERRPDSPDYLAQKVESASWLGELYMLLGRFETAIEWHEEEIELRSRLITLTDDPYHRARLADAYGHYARTLAVTGDSGGAIEKQQEQVDLYAGLRDHDPTNMMWRHSHEFGLAQLGEYELDSGAVATARRRVDASGAATLALLDSAPENVSWIEAQANVDIIRARIELESRAAESLDHARKALERLLPLVEDEGVGPTVLRTYVRAAILASTCYQRLDQASEARELAARALDLLTRWGNPAESVFDAAYRVLLLNQLDRSGEARELAGRLSSLGFEEALYRSLEPR